MWTIVSIYHAQTMVWPLNRNQPLCVFLMSVVLQTEMKLFCVFTEYPLNPKSRSPRMLVIKKGNTKDLQISGFPVGGNIHSQPAKNGTGASVYKGLVPKPVIPPAKVCLQVLFFDFFAIFFYFTYNIV